MSDYHTLLATLQRIADEAQRRPLSLGEVVDSLDEAAYAFAVVILTLPFLQPVPLGPITVAAGLGFAALGWQLLRGHESPVLPRKIREAELSEKTWRTIVKACMKILGFCRKFTRPRMQHLVTGRLGQKVGGLIMLAGGLLMAIPFPIPLPGNNALPALAMLFQAIGELEEDGMMIFIALFWLVASVVYFAVYYLILWFFGKGALAFL